MKIIELLEPKTTAKQDVKDLAKGAFSGAKAFIRGAGGPDIDAASKYLGPTIKGDKDKSTRGIGQASREPFNQVMASMYGSNLDDSIIADWEEAIASGNAETIKAVNNKYEENPGLRTGAQNPEKEGKLKKAHKQTIANLAGIDVAELGSVGN